MCWGKTGMTKYVASPYDIFRLRQPLSLRGLKPERSPPGALLFLIHRNVSFRHIKRAKKVNHN